MNLLQHDREPRVLVVSHNAFDPQGNMGRTLSALFRCWQRENVAQLYFRRELPDTTAAGRFYRVTDFDVLRTLRGGKYKGTVTADSGAASRRQQAVYQYGRRRAPWQYAVRSLIWALGRWYTPELRAWLAKFRPQVIFFAAGGYSFAYGVARRLGRELGIPVVPYFCDDYYFLDKGSRSPLYRWVRWDIRREIRRMASRAPCCLCISEQMAAAYESEFGRECHVLMTGSARPGEGSFVRERSYSHEEPFLLRYTGRLGLGRDMALAALGRGIRAAGLPVALEVYTTETDPKYLACMTAENGIVLKGALPAEEVLPVMRQADGVLHIESHDREMMERTRYSVSTKIPDLLASGVCPVVFGPRGLASVDYLEENGGAQVISRPEDIAGKLRELLSFARRQELVCRALALAAEGHDGEKNSKKLKAILAAAGGNSEEP